MTQEDKNRPDLSLGMSKLIEGMKAGNPSLSEEDAFRFADALLNQVAGEVADGGVFGNFDVVDGVPTFSVWQFTENDQEPTNPFDTQANQ